MGWKVVGICNNGLPVFVYYGSKLTYALQFLKIKELEKQGIVYGQTNDKEFIPKEIEHKQFGKLTVQPLQTCVCGTQIYIYLGCERNGARDQFAKEKKLNYCVGGIAMKIPDTLNCVKCGTEFKYYRNRGVVK